MPSVTATSTTVSKKRPRSTASSSSSSAKRSPTQLLRSSNPLEIKPLGNLLFNPGFAATRQQGLGLLGLLPDELLLSHIVSALEGEDLMRFGACSKAAFAWSCMEGIWKGIYISKTGGRLHHWTGSWRSSYLTHFLRPRSIPYSTPLPSFLLTTPTLHSDVLFQPSLCASFDPLPIFLAPSFSPTIDHLDGRNFTPSTLPDVPCIFTHLLDNWEAMNPISKRRWTLPSLVERFDETILFRAEATLTSLRDYERYHDDCAMDESPLYLFESGLVEKTAGKDEGGFGLGDDYDVPQCFTEDLFAVMGNERPDYRWLIVGPTRSGSTFHKDPNGTSAWNAVTTGAKAWVCFPPHVIPPGVFVSEDMAEVEAPLSLAEWFMSYYKQAKALYGPKASDPKTRGLMLEGICRAGECFFVPSGWWHIVINLSPSIAVTQNFVSRTELPNVLTFMKERPSQVSGFKLAGTAGLDEEDCDNVVSGVYEAFCEALEREREEIFQGAQRVLRERKEAHVQNRKEGNGVWRGLKEGKVEGEEEVEFSFGFFGTEELGEMEA